MFFSNKGSFKNGRREKKRNRNIYGIFGRSDSDNSDSGDEERFKPILKDSDSSPDNYDSDDSDNYGKYKKTTNRSKYSKGYNSKKSSKNEKNTKRTDFLGFVSGGTLNLSQMDSSVPNTAKEDYSTEHQPEDYNSDMELNSDEELLSHVIDYDDYVLVEEDEELLSDKRKQLQMEKRMREQYNTNFSSTSYREKQLEELDSRDKDNEALKEDKMKKIYGKGLNMLKKMGYKGGGLGREGKGLVNPLTFSSSKDNKSVYKIEELDKDKRMPQTRLSQSGLSSDSMEGQLLQSTGVSEGDNWLEWLNKRYNQSLSRKEEVENKRKELNKLNLRLNEEIKQLNLEVQRKLNLLEEFETLRPKIEKKYQEFLETLNDFNRSNTRNTTITNNGDNNSIEDNRDSNSSSTDKTSTTTNKSDEDKENSGNKIEEVVEKLIKLLKLLNKVHFENKMNKVAVRMTFKNLFDSDFRSDICNNLNKYDVFFKSLPVINKYYNYSRENNPSGLYGNNDKNNDTYLDTDSNDGNDEIKALLNYYVVKSLVKYYRDVWDPVNVDKGLNLYQYIHEQLSGFYQNTTSSNSSSTNNSTTSNNNTDKNTSSNSRNTFGSNTNNTGNEGIGGGYNSKNNNLQTKDFTTDIDLNAVIKEIERRLVQYIENLSNSKELYNCHIFVFPWLQYFQNNPIHRLVDVFLETLFKNTDQLIDLNDEVTPYYENNPNNSDINSNTNHDIRFLHHSVSTNRHYDCIKNVEKYQNIYSNWSKLLLDKKDFEKKLYDKLYEQLSTVNTNLIFSLDMNDTDAKLGNYSNTIGINTTSSGEDSNSSSTNKTSTTRSNRLNELIEKTLCWNKLVDEETMVKLLFNTILVKFRQFLVQSISSLSRNYDEYLNNTVTDNEYNKVLRNQREKIIGFYLHFKSLLPSYVNKNKNVQDHCFKVILNKMESFVNCYSNTGVEANTDNTRNTTGSNTNNTTNNNNDRYSMYNREYESEESSGSGDEDY